MSSPNLDCDLVAARFVVLRAPVLPYRLLDSLNNVDDGDDEAAANRRLWALSDDPAVQEALHLSSPGFSDRYQQWLSRPDRTGAVKFRRVLYRYIARLTSRCTPFGVAATTTIGETGTAVTSLLLHDGAPPHREIAVAFDYLAEITVKIDRATRNAFSTFRANPTLFEQLGEYHFYSFPTDGGRALLRSLPATGYLRKLAEAAKAPLEKPEIVALLQAELPEFAIDEIASYCDGLIADQFLLSTLPALTGEEPFHSLVARREELTSRGAPVAVDVIQEIERSLSELRRHADAASGEFIRAYKAATTAVPQSATAAWRIDATRDGEITLSDRDATQLLTAAGALLRMPRAHDRWLAALKSAFAKTHGSGPVRLAKLFHPESGIGLSAIDPSHGFPDVEVPATTTEASDDRFQWVRFWEQRLARLPMDRLPLELRLSDDDLASFEDPRTRPMPGAFALLAVPRLRRPMPGGEPREAVDCRYYVRAAGGATGIEALARFCFQNAELKEHVAAFCARFGQSSPDALVADICYVGRPRDGNVLARPSLLPYEIVLSAASAVCVQRQIGIDELDVYLHDGCFRLYCNRLANWVWPRPTTPHNFFHSKDPIYQFLCRMPLDQPHASSFEWGPQLSRRRFLPRIVYRGVALSLAQWLMPGELIRELAALDPRNMATSMHEWRIREGVPRRVNARFGEDFLTVDLDSVLALDALVDAVRDRSTVVLEELFADGEHLAVAGSGGGYQAELFLPVGVIDRRTSTPRAGSQRQAIDARAHWGFPSGPWTSLRIVCTTSAQDSLLVDWWSPIADELRARGARNLFFVRSPEDESHLRLRWCFDECDSSLESARFVHASLLAWIERGHVKTVHVDTYEREVDRYGGVESLACSEKFFAADSAFALSALPAVRTGSLERWVVFAIMADSLMDAFAHSNEERKRLVIELRDSTVRDLRLDSSALRSLPEWCRDRIRRCAAALARDGAEAELADAGLSAAHCLRTEAARNAWARMTALETAQQLTRPSSEILESLIHMSGNRMLGGPARLHEIAVYELLAKAYNHVALRAAKPG